VTIKPGLGTTTLVFLVVANMIGAGVFTTSGFAMGDLGTPARVMAAWLTGGCLALCGALSYGALARLYPVSGGEYLYLSRVIHPMAGFVAGWISLLAGFTGAIALAAITFEVYVWPGTLPDMLPENSIATLAILLAALLHGLQARHGALVQNSIVALKLILIGGFIFIALYQATAGLPGANPGLTAQTGTAGAFSITAFAVTLMWVSFSYSGFNAAIYVASEVPGASRKVPAAMVLATALVMGIYLVLNAIFVLAPAAAEIANRSDVAAVAARVLGGESLAAAVRAIVAVALFTSVSAMIMAGPRVYAQMADDGLLPEVLCYRQAAPGYATGMQALLAIIVVWIAGLRELLSYLGMTLSLSAAATVCCLFVLIRRNPAQKTGLTGYPWAPAIYVTFTFMLVAIAALRTPVEMLAALITILSGVIVYYYFAADR
jgi:APA family basic amino acid/polyamine antiporter